MDKRRGQRPRPQRSGREAQRGRPTRPQAGQGGDAAAARTRRPPRGSRAKPPLPDERPRLPQDVYEDIRAASSRSETDDVARALGGAEQALERGDPDEAIPLLEWAKAAAARSWAVREALGIAYYLAERYRDAHRELLTYRRLTGREDQNHLLADCARAADDHEKVRAYVDAMLEADVDESRVVEGLIVLAGDQADRGELDAALHTLSHVDPDPAEPAAHHLRAWYLQAVLHERRGEDRRAQQLRASIADIDPEYLKVLDG